MWKITPLIVIKCVKIQKWLTGHNYYRLQFGCAADEKEHFT